MGVSDVTNRGTFERVRSVVLTFSTLFAVLSSERGRPLADVSLRDGSGHWRDISQLSFSRARRGGHFVPFASTGRGREEEREEGNFRLTADESVSNALLQGVTD